MHVAGYSILLLGTVERKSEHRSKCRPPPGWNAHNFSADLLGFCIDKQAHLSLLPFGHDPKSDAYHDDSMLQHMQLRFLHACSVEFIYSGNAFKKRCS
jgi:hypothetical protein